MANAPGPVVDVKGVSLAFRSGDRMLTVLDNLDLRVDASEVVAIVGPSGSGKTSLMMVLAGLEQAVSGEVRVAGHDLNRLDEDGLAIFRRDNIGILFQNFHLLPSLTALENVALPMEVAETGIKPCDIAMAAEGALADVGLAHRLEHLPGALSGGEQQRVALARALVTRPRLLLADEPTGNLDQETGARVVDLSFSMARRDGIAVLLITHDPVLAARADRVLTMNRGRLSI